MTCTASISPSMKWEQDPRPPVSVEHFYISLGTTIRKIFCHDRRKQDWEHTVEPSSATENGALFSSKVLCTRKQDNSVPGEMVS